MATVQILFSLRDFSSFLHVFSSDLLPQSNTQTSATLIINSDPHTEGGSHWLAVHFRPKSSSAYYFDSYGIIPLVPDIQAFIKRNCTAWGHYRRHLQVLRVTSAASTAVYSASAWIGATLRTIHLVLRCMQRTPTGGEVIRYRIRGQTFTWLLGSMLSQLPIN